VVNRCVVGTIIGRDVRDALTGPIAALRSVISQRVAFAESVATGQLVRELDSSGSAAREIAALAAEVMERAA
jgi:chromosome partitioning protein